MMQRYELLAWLGPTAEDLNEDQINVVALAAEDLLSRYPDPDDDDLRNAAMSTVVQWLLGELKAEDVSRTLVDARAAQRRAFASAVQVAMLLVADGAPKASAARRCGIDRMSLLKALGAR